MASGAVATSAGFTVGTRTDTTTSVLYKAGGQIGSSKRVFTGYPTLGITLGNRGGEFSYPSRRDYGYASVGDGLTAAEVEVYYTIVQEYQLALGRAR
jgi:hypothetical protein